MQRPNGHRNLASSINRLLACWHTHFDHAPASQLHCREILDRVGNYGAGVVALIDIDASRSGLSAKHDVGARSAVGIYRAGLFARPLFACSCHLRCELSSRLPSRGAKGLIATLGVTLAMAIFSRSVYVVRLRPSDFACTPYRCPRNPVPGTERNPEGNLFGSTGDLDRLRCGSGVVSTSAIDRADHVSF